MKHRGVRPTDSLGPTSFNVGLRTAVLVAVATMAAAALLLALGGWSPEFCSALRPGYPLCAL